jgi:hypothetical protein
MHETMETEHKRSSCQHDKDAEGYSAADETQVFVSTKTSWKTRHAKNDA